MRTGRRPEEDKGVGEQGELRELTFMGNYIMPTLSSLNPTFYIMLELGPFKPNNPGRHFFYNFFYFQPHQITNDTNFMI